MLHLQRISRSASFTSVSIAHGGFVIWITCSASFIRFISPSFNLSPIFFNLSSYSFWENFKFSSRSFMSMLRLSRRWLVNELLQDINCKMDCFCLWSISWFLWTIDASRSFSIFSRLLSCPASLNFWSWFQTVFATNLNVYAIRYCFFSHLGLRKEKKKWY